MTKYNFISSGLVTTLLIIMISCNAGKETGSEVKKTELIPQDIVEMRVDQVKLANIELGPVENRSISSTLKVNGIVSVAPQNLAKVCMPMGGFIKSTSLMPGNAVHKGQILAVLENQEFIDIQQNYLDTKNKLDYAEAEYLRHTELYKNDVYSKNNLQQVTADYKSLKAQVKGLEQKLNLLGFDAANFDENDISSSVSLLSPISGYITAVNVNLGKYVAPSDILFEIINSDKLYLELILFEKDANKVSVGQKIRFFINNETEPHEAIINQTGKSINADKSFKVYANVPVVCKNLLPGMYVNASIEGLGNRVKALPSEAIVSFDDRNFIFIFDKNKEESGMAFTEYRMIEVLKGVSENGYTEIILPEKFNILAAKVVVKGAYNLLSAKKNAGEMSC